MGELMRAFDWSPTSMGPVSCWPRSLITAVRIILTSRYAMFVWWGRELVNLYNDPYRAFLGIKHPAALAQSARDVWSEIWEQIGPRTDAVLLRGESTFDQALLLLMERHGYLEETYFTFGYSPLPDDQGNIGGLFCAVTEETAQVLGERRLRLLREIAAATAAVRTPLEVCRSAARCLSQARRDLPFSLIYLIQPDSKALARAGEAGIAPTHPAGREYIELDSPGTSPWPFQQVMETGEPVLVQDLPDRFPELPTGEWSRAPESAILFPIADQGQKRPAGVFVAGLNPHRKFDEDFGGFVALLANQISSAIANAMAYENACRSAEELRRNQQQLQIALVASQHLAAIVESSDDAIVSKDLNGIVTSWNSGAEKMFGYTSREMIGRPILTIIPPELQDDENRILATIARGDRIEHFETERVGKNGRRIEVSLTISPVKDDEGRIIGAAKIARDITQAKRAERALRTSERLASVGRLAATVAHEINNPLEAITNLVYLAKNSDSQGSALEYLTKAEEELERISHITRQTLGFYRETKGATRIRIGTLVTSLLSVFSSRIRSKQLEVRTEIKQDPEVHVIPGEIRQVIANLFGNSIDAVETGGHIRVRVSALAAWGSQPRPGVRVTIADNGLGIPNDIRPMLFEPFFTTKKDVGTGLGLWVCKSIIRKHGGSIRFRSSTTPGRSGTAFSVFFPATSKEEFAGEALEHTVRIS